MPVPREIIDNSEDNKLSSFLKEMLKDSPSVNFDIATAFFNVGTYALLQEALEGVSRFRLLLGKAPEIRTDPHLWGRTFMQSKKRNRKFRINEKQRGFSQVIHRISQNG